MSAASLPRPTVGLFVLAGDSWWEMGVIDAAKGRYAGFMSKVEQDVRNIREALEAEFRVVSSGIVHTVEAAVAEARRFNQERVDAVLYVPIIWTNDQPLVAFLRELAEVPLLLWSYDPYDRVLDYYSISDWLRASAPVSIQQSTNIFQRFGRPYSHLLGNEQRPETRRALTAFVRAAAVRRSLTGTRIAVFPSPCRVVISTWLDELELASRFGVELVYVSVAEYEGLLAQVSEAQVRDTVAWLKGFPVSEVDEEHLRASARQSLAMVAMAEKHGLSGIAIEDFNQEFYTRFGYRPHLYHPALGERLCTVGLEADVLGVLATVIAGRLAGRIGMFTEFYTVDPHRDLVLMGHPGYGELSFAQADTIQVTPDIEIDDSHDRGVWISYRAAEGRMSFLNLTACRGSFKGGFFAGQCLGGPRLMEGYAHMLVKPDASAEGLFERIVDAGLFQHWGAAYGDIRPELGHLLRLLGVEQVRLG
jgi:L-fucose isomerase-like protein